MFHRLKHKVCLKYCHFIRIRKEAGTFRRVVNVESTDFLLPQVTFLKMNLHGKVSRFASQKLVN